MGRIIDLTGQEYGRLTVLEYAGKTKDNKALWLCECECGNRKKIIGKDIRTGHTRSCGCLQRETAAQAQTIHGHRYERLHNIWAEMIQRCSNSNNANYKNWGGRGITVCSEWRESYEAFRTWALANGYNETAPRGQCTIDRIDNNGNYEPSNCRWVDMKVQRHNRRDTVSEGKT